VSKETYYSEAKAGQGTTTKNIKQNKKMKRTRQLIFRKKRKKKKKKKKQGEGKTEDASWRFSRTTWRFSRSRLEADPVKRNRFRV